MAKPVVPKVRTLSCPNCGGSVELRGYGQTVNAVCIQCLSVLDTRSPGLQVLQQFQVRERYMPAIPLGTRGKLNDTVYEVIGFQVRGIEVEGVAYQWSEYLLFNPYKGYRYLTDYQGHWNSVRTLRRLPTRASAGSKQAVLVDGIKYKHFQSALARTIYVMGEFPWQVRVGESVSADDYIAPPGVVSSEETADEIVWSIGTYTPGKQIWEAFQLKGSPPRPLGIYANQPSPHKGRIRSVWTWFLLLLTLLFGGMIAIWVLSPNQEVFRQSYSFTTTQQGERSFVTPIFELKGRESNVEVRISTDLSNDWAFFGLALIDDDTGIAYDFGKELGFYYGRDSDGGWTEGNANGNVSVPAVKPGRYYLRIEPEMENDRRDHRVNYQITVNRGVPGFGWFIVALALLPLPAIITTWRAFQFENRRWAESDYGSPFTSSSNSKGDDE